MKLIYSKTCPGWVKELADAAIVVIGCPARIGKHLEGLKSPRPDLPWHEDAPKLFATHGLWVSYGYEDFPWLTITPEGATINRDEVVRLYQDH